MKSQARKIFSYFGTLPYTGALYFIQFAAKLFDSGFEVWPRNSLALGYFQPGFSDLDLTLYAADTQKSVKSFLNFYSFCQLFVPFLGEINCYNPQKLSELQVFGNLFELQRDPTLFKKMGWGRNPTTVEAAVFLLRQLEKDVHQIEKYPTKRLRKWTYHLELVKSFFSDNPLLPKVQLTAENLKYSIEFFIIALCDIQNPVFRDRLYKILEFYFDCVLKNLSFHKINSSIISDSWFYCFAFPRMNKSLLTVGKLNSEQKEFLEFQYKWEMAGFLSQATDLELVEVYQKHLENVRASIIQLSGGHFSVGQSPIETTAQAALWK